MLPHQGRAAVGEHMALTPAQEELLISERTGAIWPSWGMPRLLRPLSSLAGIEAMCEVPQKRWAWESGD